MNVELVDRRPEADDLGDRVRLGAAAKKADVKRMLVGIEDAARKWLVPND